MYFLTKSAADPGFPASATSRTGRFFETTFFGKLLKILDEIQSPLGYLPLPLPEVVVKMKGHNV